MWQFIFLMLQHPVRLPNRGVMMTEGNGFSQNAMRILKARYFMKSEDGEFLDKSPSDLFFRVARQIALAEETRVNRKNGKIDFLNS